MISIITRGTLAVLIVFFIFGCAYNRRISLQEADDIELRFQNHSMTKPPRSLGPLLRKYISRYVDHWKPIDECGRPQEHLTDQEIHAISKNYSKYSDWQVREWAREEYFNGNLHLAERVARSAALNANNYVKVIPLADRAKYLSESGDFDKATELLNQARGGLSRGGNGYNGLKYIFHFQTAAGSIAFSKAEIDRSIECYLKAYNVCKSNRIFRIREGGAWRIGEAQLGIARALMWQGKLVKAEMWARNAIETLDFGGVVSITKEGRYIPYAFIILSKIFFEQARYDDAEACGRAALNMLLYQCMPIDSVIRAQARESLAQIMSAVGKWSDALEQVNMIQHEMITNQVVFNSRFKGNNLWGLALIKTGDPEKALDQLEFALKRAKKIYGKSHYITAETIGFKALAFLALNRIQDAKEEFETAIPILLERWNAQSGLGTTNKVRSVWFRHIVEGYLDLFTTKIRRNQENLLRALELAEIFRVQSVARSIISSASRSYSGDAGLAELIRKKQDTEIRISVLRSRLINLEMHTLSSSQRDLISKINTNIEQLEAAASAFEIEINDRFPDYTKIVSPSLLSIAEARNHLHKNEVFISIFTGEKGTYSWVLRKGGPCHFNKVKLGDTAAKDVVSKLRESMDATNITKIGDILDYNFPLSYGLFKRLILPFYSKIQETDHLIFSVSGPLGQLPFSILTTSDYDLPKDKMVIFDRYREAPWLISSNPVSYVPSISALVSLRSIPDAASSRKPFIGFGDPIFAQPDMRITDKMKKEVGTRSYHKLQCRAKIGTREFDIFQQNMLPRLPETADELLKLSETLGADPKKDVYLGKMATEKEVKSANLADRNVVAFATHGLVPGDLNGLNEPALAMTTPVKETIEDNGLLTMGEIMGLKLNADWVILSACNTAGNEGEGAESLSGLGRAFFYSGAKSLLATSWAVESTSATALTTGLFNKQIQDKKIGKAERLQKSKIRLINELGLLNPKTGNVFAAYSHPFFWAPFILVGDGGY